MKPVLKLNDNPMYFNLNKCHSYNDLFIFILLGARGLGKTTGCLIDAIRSFVNKNEQFIYLRRYKSELKGFVHKNPIRKIVDKSQYKGDGMGGYTCYIDNKIMGSLIPLTTTQEYKSADFSEVTSIIFDEAVLKPHSPQHYLDNEVEVLLEFISTVQRTRTNLKIYILGNNLDLFNPYTAYFNVPNLKDKAFVDHRRGLYVELLKDNPQLREIEEKTPLYKLTQGTAYGDYHYNNKVLSNAVMNTIQKPSNCVLLCRFKMVNLTLNIYTFENKEHTDGYLYVELRDRIIDDNISYAIEDKNGNPNYYDIQQIRLRFKNFISSYYYAGNVGYSEDKAASIMSAIMEEI